MRDVYLSDASERIDAYALSHGELITRNGSQLHSRSLGASENNLLSQKLDEQKQQFLSQARSLIEAYIEKEAQLSRLLPRDIQDALKKCVSLSLLPLQNFLQGLSFCDVRTEILRGWLDAESSSSPITDETHPTDSQSTGRNKSVADQSGPEASFAERAEAAASLAKLLPQSALDSLIAGEPNAATDALLHEAAANELLLRRRA